MINRNDTMVKACRTSCSRDGSILKKRVTMKVPNDRTITQLMTPKTRKLKRTELIREFILAQFSSE